MCPWAAYRLWGDWQAAEFGPFRAANAASLSERPDENAECSFSIKVHMLLKAGAGVVQWVCGDAAGGETIRGIVSSRGRREPKRAAGRKLRRHATSQTGRGCSSMGLRRRRRR